MSFNDDPYNYDGEFDREYEVFMPAEHPAEEKIYVSLIGTYRVAKNVTDSTIDKEIWQSVNSAIEKFSALGKDYSEFVLSDYQPNGMKWVSTYALQSKLMSLLEVIAHEFDFTDPNFLIYRSLPSGSQNIYATANASPTQTVTQEQNTVITIEQHISWITKELENNFSPEQLEQVKNELKEYKSNPKKWQFVQNLIIKLLTFGTAAAPIVLKIMEKYLSA